MKSADERGEDDQLEEELKKGNEEQEVEGEYEEEEKWLCGLADPGRAALTSRLSPW